MNNQMNIYTKLFGIQQTLKVSKDEYNNFGKFSYRSAEQIIESVKPLLEENRLILLTPDTIVQVGQRNYFQVTAILIDVDTKEQIEVTANAREDESLKGMSNSQISGSTASYAKKYALQNLFALDNSKDADSNEFSKIKKENDDFIVKMKNLIANCKTIEELTNVWNNNSEIQNNPQIKPLFTKRKKELRK